MSRLRRRRTRQGSPLVAGAYATVLAVGVALVAFPPSPGDVDRYVAMGSFDAAGSGVSQSGGGYAQRLAERLHRDGVPLYTNLADVSDTAGELRRDGQLDEALRVFADEDSTTRVVTLGIGFGDLVDPRCATGPTASGCPFEAEFTQLVRRLSEALAEEGSARLLLLGLWQPFPDADKRELVETNLQGTDGRVDCSGTAAARGFNDVIACVGARHGADFVGTRNLIAKRPESLLIDGEGVLPSTAGHAAIARRLVEALDEPSPVRNAPEPIGAG